jgi:serine/threonine protein kinase
MLIDDRYRLETTIAAGGMGQVWRATDTVLGRTVAVKVLHELVDEAARERFRNEARAMAALRHPGVADVYDYGETTLPDGVSAAYIVMACVEGQPLSRRIAEAGRLDAALTAPIIAQAADALQAVHDAGVVHRDVKPANLIIDPDGQIVLIDFGVAVTRDGGEHTAVNEVVGTALYMAPEQVAKRPLTPATDIYALGAVAYHCLAGHPPFVGDDAITVALRHLDDEPPPLPDDVPADLRQVVATAMAKDPRQRYPTAAAMAGAASGGQAGDPDGTVVLGAALPAAVPPPAPPRRSRTPSRVIAGVLLGLAAMLAVLAFADPTGIIQLPGDPPRRPATTTDPDSVTTTDPDTDTTVDPAGGAGGDRQPVTGGPDASTGPDAGRPATDATPAGGDPRPSPGGDDPAAPEPTPPPNEPEPTTPAEPEPTPPDDPEPTEEPAASASPDETAAESPPAAVSVDSSPSTGG